MDDKDDKDVNPLDKQLNEIEEWQKNALNPGYYVGNGKVPLPTKNFYKSPIVLILFGAIFFIPSLYNIIQSFSIGTILSNIIQVIIGFSLLLTGFLKILKKKSN